MSATRQPTKLLHRPIFLSCVILVACMIGIWILGPDLRIHGAQPLANATTRLLGTFGLFVVWAFFILWQLHRKEQIQPISIHDLPSSSKPYAQLEKRFRGAMQFLKRTPQKSNEKLTLSALPHYLLLGPSGSGKTSLLTNSGLRFILSKNQEHLNPLHIPSTDDCDFWATKEAVLIDCGRDYTIHNHLGNQTKLVWQVLLRLLKKARRKAAINGVILVVSLPELERWTRNKKARHENNIRQRLEEINATFGVNTPVYLLLSKCDKIAGFQDFFAAMSRTERNQILGTTFPLHAQHTKHFFANRFNDEFDNIIKRLSERTIKHLHQERNAEKRANLLPFSWCFARYKAVLASFIQNSFDASDTETGLNLRGVYFTSSVQDSPSVKDIAAQSHALQQHDLNPAANPFKSYFIEHVFRKVIFHEATSIYPEQPKTLKPLLVQKTIYATCAVALLGSTVWWSIGLSHNLGLLNRAIYHLGQYQVLKLQLPEDDISKVVPQIDQLAVLKQLTKEVNSPWSITYLSKNNLHTAASNAFYTALQNTFLPAVGRELAAQISDVASTDPRILIGAVTAYMMLAEPINLKPQFVQAWLKVYWEQSYPDAPALTQALQNYLRMALGGITQGIPINPDIVSVAEHVLTAKPNTLQPSNSIALASQVPLSSASLGDTNNDAISTANLAQQNPADFSAATLETMNTALPQIPVVTQQHPTQLATAEKPAVTESKKTPAIKTQYGTITIE